jgi:hypothetical protein
MESTKVLDGEIRLKQRQEFLNGRGMRVSDDDIVDIDYDKHCEGCIFEREQGAI